ncbi:hypothetical protein CMK14_12170 [Candidatus Poribacteria bacterium]|mgnify:FL=1|nr:hypothetical protein [Candidatus Poribacteria bacterium]
MDAGMKKTALRMIPYGLYILTAKTGDDRVAASTVNWVTQTSFDPPLIVVVVKVDSSAHDTINETGAYMFFKPLGKESYSELVKPLHRFLGRLRHS